VFGPILLATVIGLFWFALAFALLMRSGSHKNSAPDGEYGRRNGTRFMLREITVAAGIACVLAVSAWTGLYLNDEILESRSVPWIAPLIRVQIYGFGKADQLFPCQSEGSDKGCEYYKWIPTFLAANSLLYFPFVLIGVFSFQKWPAVGRVMRAGAPWFARGCIVVAATGLIALQVMYGLQLATHDSLYPHPGVAHWHFGMWEQVNDITGTVIVIDGLLLPFFFYRTIRGAGDFTALRSRLAEFTSLTAVTLMALMLGNPW
jgi:hypothetical protein